MKIALYEEGRFWESPDIKRVFRNVDIAKDVFPDGFEIKNISGLFNADSRGHPTYYLYAENAGLERWAAIKEYEVEREVE